MKSILLIISFLILFTAGLAIKTKLKEKEPSASPSISLTPTTTPKSRTEPLKVKVSIPYWDQKRAVKSFKDNVDKVDYVSLFWFFLNSDGEIKKYQYTFEDRTIIDFAHANGVKVEVVITNLPEEGDWDSERVEKVIGDAELRSKHIEEIVELVTSLGIDGVDIDYEQLDDDLVESFSKFIEELGRALDAYGKYLGVALHPKSDDGIGLKNGSQAQDWRRLSEGADNLYIMAYGEHSDGEDAGPIASIPWVSSIVSYAKTQEITREKLFLGIPLYGYDFDEYSKEPATGLTFEEVARLMSEVDGAEGWDEKFASPHFHYGESHEVWFENAASVEKKIELAYESGLAGITFWRLGGEDPKLWDVIEKYRQD